MNLSDIKAAARSQLEVDLGEMPKIVRIPAIDDLYMLGFARGAYWALNLTPADFHDDKPCEIADKHVTTESGDLDLAGRPLRQGD
jgi:hypothetical protein